MKNVTAIVISFLRVGYTKKCVKSLRHMYPDIKIRVGENGHYSEEMAEFCKEQGAEYIDLPFDSGVCVARNILVKGVETEYVMVGDDDFYYKNDENTKPMVQEMTEFLDVMGDVIMGWMLLWRANVAAPKLAELLGDLEGEARLEKINKNKNAAFYEGQVRSAEYFIQAILPVTIGKMASIEACSKAIVEIPEVSFGG